MATFWDGQEAQSGIIQSYDWGQEAQVDWFEAVAKLEGDNCHADTVVTGMDGTLMWLKDAFPSNGRRIGVAACCPKSAPCPWHAALGRLQRGLPPRHGGTTSDHNKLASFCRKTLKSLI